MDKGAVYIQLVGWILYGDVEEGTVFLGGFFVSWILLGLLRVLAVIRPSGIVAYSRTQGRSGGNNELRPNAYYVCPTRTHWNGCQPLGTFYKYV
jgi:hypothetical protein